MVVVEEVVRLKLGERKGKAVKGEEERKREEVGLR